jgi:hypothetical protein
MRSIRLTAAMLAGVAVAAMMTACGGDERSATTPLAPTGAATASGTARTTSASGSTASSGAGPRNLLLSPSGAPLPAAGVADVEFPGRQDAFQFRSDDLERIYRDQLRAGLFATYVNPEGSVVWVAEYLRYRVNQCSHEEAIDRVLTQIGGGGVLPVCGQQRQPFPGREQALDFRRRLESVYRDTLRAGIAQTYVNDEGDVIWTMEYLRYRLSGCDHITTIQKIVDQIGGRGVPPECSSGGGGTVTPPATVNVDFVMKPSPCPLRQEGSNTRTQCTFDAGPSQVPGRITRYTWSLNDGFERSTTNPVFDGWAVPCGTLPTIRIEVGVRLTIDTTQGTYSRRWPVLFENNNGC